MERIRQISILLLLVVSSITLVAAQAKTETQGLIIGLMASVPLAREGEPDNFFHQYIGLKDSEIADIRSGKAVGKILNIGEKPEIVAFGAVYVEAPIARYIELFRDLSRLEKVDNYLAIKRFSDPPRLEDLEGFSLDEKDIDDLKKCKPGKCQVQLPAEIMEQFDQKVDWSAPDAYEQLNRLAREDALEMLKRYQSGGNEALGTYRDKKKPLLVAQQFEALLGRSEGLPHYFPEFHRYLLEYPNAPLEGAEDYFYWEKVKFGLKPTIRVNHVTIYKASGTYVTATKQLYSSHYFQTALDLSFCVKDSDAPDKPGFFLITVKGSRQDGLTGLKGSIVRHVVTGRTRESMETAMRAMKTKLEEEATN